MKTGLLLLRSPNTIRYTERLLKYNNEKYYPSLFILTTKSIRSVLDIY